MYSNTNSKVCKSLFQFFNIFATNWTSTSNLLLAWTLVVHLICLKFIVFFVTYLRWFSIFDELRVAIILNLSKMLDFRSNFSVGINDSLNFKSRAVGARGDFVRSVNPYLNWGAYYAHDIYYLSPPPDF